MVDRVDDTDPPVVDRVAGSAPAAGAPDTDPPVVDRVDDTDPPVVDRVAGSAPAAGASSRTGTRVRRTERENLQYWKSNFFNTDILPPVRASRSQNKYYDSYDTDIGDESDADLSDADSSVNESEEVCALKLYWMYSKVAFPCVDYVIQFLTEFVFISTLSFVGI